MAVLTGKLSQYIPNVLAQVIGRIFPLTANLVTFALIARMLGTEVFGRYSYIMTFLSLAVIVAEFGTTPVLTTQLAQVAKNDREVYWGNFLALRGGLCFLTIFPALIAGLLP